MIIARGAVGGCSVLTSVGDEPTPSWDLSNRRYPRNAPPLFAATTHG